MKTVTIASFETRSPADQLQQRLTAAGIPAEVSDERALQRCWFFAHPHAAFRLKVPAEQVETAGKLFVEWQAHGGALHEAIRCPQCKSLQVDYPQMTRKFVTPTLVAHFLTALGFLRHEFYCQHCQFTWRLPTKLGWRTLPQPPAQAPKTFHHTKTV